MTSQARLEIMFGTHHRYIKIVIVIVTNMFCGGSNLCNMHNRYAVKLCSCENHYTSTLLGLLSNGFYNVKLYIFIKTNSFGTV